jgi:hypothetical protein
MAKLSIINDSDSRVWLNFMEYLTKNYKNIRLETQYDELEKFNAVDQGRDIKFETEEDLLYFKLKFSNRPV